MKTDGTVSEIQRYLQYFEQGFISKYKQKSMH